LRLTVGNLFFDDFLHVTDLSLCLVETRQISLQKAQNSLVVHVEVSEQVLYPEKDAHEATVHFVAMVSHQVDQLVNKQFEVVQVLLRQLK